MCELITMAGSNFLDGRKKYCAVGKWWSENHKYLFKALKIFFIEISKPIYISIFLSEMLEKERR